jgi:stage V sporulation protein G
LEITEIRIKLMEDSEDRLRAFCSITIDDCFVVRDLKIIDGTSGPFVAMPSRKLTAHCQRCNHKNHLRASYCNHCGIKLQTDDGGYDSPQKLYADVAHPINSECREMIQNAVIEEFEAELRRCKQPGYRSRYDDDFGYEDVEAGDLSGTQARADRKSDTTPPKPHFDRPPHEAAGVDEDEDSFGAGIFD